MSRKRILLGLIIVALFFVIYSDQKFEPKDIKELIKNARSTVTILPPREFTTDGCSLWFNSILDKDFTDICIAHDIAYWQGGSAQDRKVADTELRKEINKTLPFMGDVMYFGIGALGHPLVPTPWRWGYGFEYPYRY